MAVIIICLFLTVPWVGLLYVSVAFPRYTHLLLGYRELKRVVYLGVLGMCHIVIGKWYPLECLFMLQFIYFLSTNKEWKLSVFTV